ncbi:MAG: hypothetical protein V1776_01070 [Candidatus Diapherotrites archaeon]
MDLISLKQVPIDVKRELLKELGFGVDGSLFVIDENGQRIIDKYIDKPVNISNMLVLHGSTLILDDNPLSLTAYLEEYGDVI